MYPILRHNIRINSLSIINHSAHINSNEPTPAMTPSTILTSLAILSEMHVEMVIVVPLSQSCIMKTKTALLALQTLAIIQKFDDGRRS